VGEERGTKGTLIVWKGSLGPDFFEEPVYQFSPENKSDFTKECPLRGYDNRKEDWPKCMHGEDCLSVDVHRGDRWRSSLLQMPVSMGNCYYNSFVKYVSRIPLQLTGHTYRSLLSPKKLWVH
jgi:hypothetical protein